MTICKNRCTTTRLVHLSEFRISPILLTPTFRLPYNGSSTPTCPVKGRGVQLPRGPAAVSEDEGPGCHCIEEMREGGPEDDSRARRPAGPAAATSPGVRETGRTIQLQKTVEARRPVQWPAGFFFYRYQVQGKWSVKLPRTRRCDGGLTSSRQDPLPESTADKSAGKGEEFGTIPKPESLPDVPQPAVDGKQSRRDGSTRPPTMLAGGLFY